MPFWARAWFESWGTVFSPRKKMCFFLREKKMQAGQNNPHVNGTVLFSLVYKRKNFA